MRSRRTVTLVMAVVVGMSFVGALAAGGLTYAQPAEEAGADAPAKPGGDDATPPDGAAAGAEEAAPAEEVTPVSVRLRRLEQNVQMLKERAWRSKARVGMLKEAVLGGGVGARATLVHRNDMGRAFNLVKVVYAVDGTQVFARHDAGGKLNEQRTIEILSGPIAPGNHTISVMLIYRGSGFGPFKYLKKYKYTVRSSHTFTAVEGKHTRIEIVGYEKGGWNTPLRQRPGVDFRVTTSDGGEK